MGQLFQRQFLLAVVSHRWRPRCRNWSNSMMRNWHRKRSWERNPSTLRWCWTERRSWCLGWQRRGFAGKSLSRYEISQSCLFSIKQTGHHGMDRGWDGLFHVISASCSLIFLSISYRYPCSEISYWCCSMWALFWWSQSRNGQLKLVS